MKTIKILTWLKGIGKVLRVPLKEELLKRKREFDHTINITNDSLSKTPIILLWPDDQAFIKDYLDSMLKKKYKQISKLSIGAPLFLVPKKDGKQPVIDYQKLNEITEKNSTLLPRINNTLD